MGKSAGLSGKDLSDFSNQMVQLGGDLASFKGGTAKEAVDAIGSAMRGEAEPIRRYGVLLDDASLRAEALKQGLIKTTKQALTPHQKVLAAHALILKQTRDAQGDFARTAESAKNKAQAQSAQIQDLTAKLGQALLPAYGAILSIGIRVTQWLSEHTTLVGVAVGVIAGLAGAVLAVSAAQKVWAAAQAIAKASTVAFTAVQWLLNVALSANPIGLVVIALVALAAALVIAYKKSATVRAIVNALGRAFMTAIGKVRDFVVGAGRWIGSLPGKISAIFGRTRDLLFNAGWDLINGLWQGVSAIWNQFTSWFSGAISWVADTARSILGINSPSKVFREIGSSIGEGMVLGIEGTQDAVLRATQGLVDIPASVTGPTATVNVSSGSTTAAVGTTSNPLTIELKSSGGRFEDLLVESMRAAVRTRSGGNVQLALGR
jgi:hypothetical protein